MQSSCELDDAKKESVYKKQQQQRCSVHSWREVWPMVAPIYLPVVGHDTTYIPAEHGVQDHPKAPNIDGFPLILLALDDFRRHVARGT